MREFENAGSELNLRHRFSRLLCDNKGDTNIQDIDFALDHITFESKYKTQTDLFNMLAQLIATHKKRGIKLRKYLGAFNEYEIGIIETQKIDIDNINLNWKSLKPSALSPEQKRTIIAKIDIENVIIKSYDSEFSAIKTMLGKIQKGEPIRIYKIPEKEIQKDAVEINDLLHNFGLNESDRPLFFASVLLTLTDTSFYKTYAEDKKVEDIRRDMINISARAISTIEQRNPTAQNTKEDWRIQLDAITLIMKSQPRDNVINIITKIKNIFDKTDRLTLNFDVLGKCYNVFLTYGKKEKRGDITLTPEHIKYLMCRLADVRYGDTILDTCTGSAGLLVKAMHMMEADLRSRRADIHEDIVTLLEKIKSEQLLGIEKEPKMYALACTNMKLNGDGRSNIIHGDGLKANATHIYFGGKEPDIGLINPPYSGKQSIKFLSVLCKQLRKGGKAIIICPNNFLDDHTINSQRAKLFASNTLKAVIKCNPQTFTNGVEASIFVFECGRAHKVKSDNVYYYNFENDGYSVIPRNGRIQTGDTRPLIENLIRDFNDETTETPGSYSKKIEKGYIGYRSDINDSGAVSDFDLTQADFEESIIDYYIFEKEVNSLTKRLIIELFKKAV